VTAITPNQILLLYVWFPLAVVIAILLLIARFYQRFSGDQTYYPLYLIPLVLFGAGAVRYASIDQIAGDGLGDLLMAAAGAMLIGLSALLYHQMTNGRKL
jgi:hypothetical protein